MKQKDNRPEWVRLYEAHYRSIDDPVTWANEIRERLKGRARKADLADAVRYMDRRRGQYGSWPGVGDLISSYRQMMADREQQSGRRGIGGQDCPAEPFAMTDDEIARGKAYWAKLLGDTCASLRDKYRAEGKLLSDPASGVLTRGEKLDILLGREPGSDDRL